MSAFDTLAFNLPLSSVWAVASRAILMSCAMALWLVFERGMLREAFIAGRLSPPNAPSISPLSESEASVFISLASGIIFTAKSLMKSFTFHPLIPKFPLMYGVSPPRERSAFNVIGIWAMSASNLCSSNVCVESLGRPTVPDSSIGTSILPKDLVASRAIAAALTSIWSSCSSIFRLLSLRLRVSEPIRPATSILSTESETLLFSMLLSLYFPSNDILLMFAIAKMLSWLSV